MNHVEKLVKELRWPGISGPDDHPVSVKLRVSAADLLDNLTKLRPIETAPRDGRPILGYSPEGVVYVCWARHGMMTGSFSKTTEATSGSSGPRTGCRYPLSRSPNGERA